MPYSIQIEKSAQKKLEKIDSPFFEAIVEKISNLKIDPRPAGCKKLKGRIGWRIRVADYRIIYKIEDAILTILVIDIDNRKQIYK